MRAIVPQGAIAAPLDVSPAVLALRPSAVLRTLMRQPLPVWAVMLYVCFEYVRPQAIYKSLDVLPWTQFLLLLAAGTAMLELGKRRWTLLDTAMVAFTAVVLASTVTAFDPTASRSALNIYLSWTIAYFAITVSVNTQTRFVLLLIGYFLWNLKMSMHAFRSWASIGFAFRDWGVVGAPGWFANSGEFGIQMVVTFPLALYFALGVRRHVSKGMFLLLLVLPMTAVAGTIASSSRGAILGVAAVAFYLLLQSRYKARGLLALAAFGIVTFLLMPAEQRARFAASGEDNTSASRFTFWKRGIGFANEHPLLGIGYRNWIVYYSYVWGDELEGREQVKQAHNFLVECVAELGYLGLAALVALLGGSFWMNAKTRALARRLGDAGSLSDYLAIGLDAALVGYMVSGFFVTVLYYPYLWINLAMTVALHLSVARAARSAARATAQPSPGTAPFAPVS